MKIGFVGTGVYGLALASLVNCNYEDIIMWSESDKLYDAYKEAGYITDIIDGYKTPSNIKLTRSYEEVVKDRDVVFISCTSLYVGSVCKEIKPYIKSDATICIATKGLDDRNSSFLSDVVYNILGNKKIAVLSGPTFAIDIINENPVGLAIASLDEDVINTMKKVMESSRCKLRGTDDLIGVQICGSIKNVIAIASGMIEGLGLAESSRCLLITESLHEIKYIIDELGGNPKTILSFAGVGDLLLTCTSTKSRNYSFGLLIGKEKDKDKIKEYLNNNTVEGYAALNCIHNLFLDKNINMPILNIIYKIVVEMEDPSILVDYLVTKL